MIYYSVIFYHQNKHDIGRSMFLDIHIHYSIVFIRMMHPWQWWKRWVT